MSECDLFKVTSRSDSESLVEAVSKSMRFSRLNPDKYFFLGGEPKRLCSLLLQNEYRSRAVSLMSLCLDQNFEFFDTPTPQDMVAFVTEKPEKILDHLKVELCQALSMMILRIHADVGEFARLVIEAVNMDPTIHMVFGRSTFPAIYGFFTMKMFLRLGVNLVVTIERQKGPVMVVNEMIRAIFHAAHGFWYAVWCVVSEKELESMESENVRDLIIDVMRRQLFRLTKWHAKVLAEYEKAYGRNGARELVLGIVNETILLRARFGPRLLSNEEHLMLIDVLELIQDTAGETVYELFLQCSGEELSDIPDLPQNFVSRIPFLFSDRDVQMLCEMIPLTSTIAKDSKDLIRQNQMNSRTGYRPFYVEIAVPQNKATAVVVPNRLSYTTTNHNTRIMMELENYQDQMLCVSYLEFLELTPFYRPSITMKDKHMSMLSSPEFTDFVLDHQLQQINWDIEMVNTLMAVRQTYADMARWGEFVLDTSYCLVDKYVHEQVQKRGTGKRSSLSRKPSNKDLVKHVVDTAKDQNVAPEVVIASLGQIDLSKRSSATKEINAFTKAMASFRPESCTTAVLRGGKLPEWVERTIRRSYSRGPDIILIKLIKLVKMGMGKIIPYTFTVPAPHELLSFILAFEHFIMQNDKCRSAVALGYGEEIEGIHGYILKVLNMCPTVRESILKKKL